MKTDDDVLETPLKVRFLTDNAEGHISSPSISSTSQYIMREADDVDDVEIDAEAQGQRHGFNGNGEKAACVLSKQPNELIDCLRCIQDSLFNVLSQLRRENHTHDADLLDSLYRKVNLAGPNGIVAEVVKVRPLDLRYLSPDSFTRNHWRTAALLLTNSGRALFPCSFGLASVVLDWLLRTISHTIPSKPSLCPKRARRRRMELHPSLYSLGAG